ncbi:hypothetical protein JC525_07140 [Alteromonas sp. IB21]|uniref:hypothetical protein n=1 Tax=Alteromonas sp. IB21 TaxID=2779369 RepID=UPI0018E81C44|nr:hypothetical protein [Alteromonas sp. IB21]MBJ2128709.1 hypothetical protein [Alteromonas sp. IB21]
MQIFKMLLNSLPYQFENFVLIGDFPKSTINAVKSVNAKNKVLCSLSENSSVTDIQQQPFPVLDNVETQSTFNEANLKGFSSVKQPASIKQLLPGILFESAQLESQPMTSFLSNLSVADNTANMAVLNLNGAELQYLVEDDSLLNTFNCILVSCSSNNIFDGAEDSYKGLLSHLKENNIAYSIFPAEVHPFSFLLIHRPPAWNSDSNELKQAIADKQQAEESLTQHKELLVNSKQQNSEKQKEIAEMFQKLQANEQQLSELKAQQQKLNEEKAWLENEWNNAKSKVEEQSQASKITNKLNLKLQVDLDDLRKKYSEKEQNERELSELIDELYVKLKQASEFYYELEKKYPELTDEQRD